MIPDRSWPADKAERRSIDSLIPYAKNARTHDDAQIAQIAASIREWGWTIPVLIDEQGSVIAGHGRILAARQLGVTDVPVVVAVGWSDAQKRAYVLADNKLAENAAWDVGLLRIELSGLQEIGDLSMIGFGEDELASILGQADEIAMPELPSGERSPFQQMTFTLHDEQVENVKAAMDAAKGLGPFVDTGNENSNGNALARICELFLMQHGNG